MITEKEFCTNHISSLRRPGGEALVKSNLSTDLNRPLIYIDLLDNDAYLDVGKLQGRVIGLKLDYKDTVYESDCYTYDCFYETGIWTEGVRTPYSRNNAGITQYWVRGPLDEAGNTYSVDIGFVYKSCQEVSVVDENVPLSNDSYFTSILNIGEGTKFVRLNRINRFSSTPVLHHIGDYLNKDHLSRTITGYLLDYTYKDQKVDLEEIAVSISSLLMSNYYRPIPNQLVFRDKDYSDPSIRDTIESNLSRLSRLVDKDLSSKRYGSIPRWPATYSEPEDIYGPNVDLSYQYPEVRLFDVGCYEEGCFTNSTNKTLIDREVNNRGLAWLLYAYILHKLVYVTDMYESTISAIGTYLISQIEPGYNLITEGWLHSNNYRDSERIESFILKTNVVTFIALLKAYDGTKEQLYLDKATDICEGIVTYLFNTKNKQFFDSYEERAYSIESNTYGLLFSWYIGRADITESLISYFYSTIKDPSQLASSVPLVDSMGNLIIDTLSNEVVNVNSFLGNTNDPSSLSIFNTTSSYSYVDILRVNTISTQLLQSLALDNYSVPYLSLLTLLNTTLRNYLYSNRDNISLLLASNCTLDKPLYQYEAININHKEDLYTTKFYRSFWYERFRDMWPLDYTWVSDFARSPKGVLGSILKGLSKVTANLFTQLRRVESATFLDLAHDIYLNEWGTDVKIERRFKETDSDYRSRIKYVISKLNTTKSSIMDYLYLLDIKVLDIEENWKKILTFDDPNLIGESNISNGYLAGPDYSSSNVSKLLVRQPFPLEVHEELKGIKAFGTKLIYEENICIEVDFKTNPSVCGVDVKGLSEVYILSSSIETIGGDTYTIFYLNGQEIYRTTDSLFEGYVQANPTPFVYLRHRINTSSPWTTWQSAVGTPNWSKPQGVNTYNGVTYTLLNTPSSGVSNVINPGNYNVDIPLLIGSIVDWASIVINQAPNTISIINTSSIGYLLNDVEEDLLSEIDPDLAWLQGGQVLDGSIYDAYSYTLYNSNYGRIKLR